MPSIKIADELKVGLRNDHNPLGLGCLFTAYGCESKSAGLVGYSFIPTHITGITSSSTVSANTKLFSTEHGMFLYDTDGYFCSVSDSSTWATSRISLFSGRLSSGAPNLLAGDSTTSSEGWSKSGSGFTFSSDGISYTGSPTENNWLYCTYSSINYGVACLSITTEFSSSADNGLRVLCYNTDEFITESGTYKKLIRVTTAFDYFLLQPTAGWSGTITDVSVKPVYNTTFASVPYLHSLAELPNGFITAGTANYYYDNRLGLFSVPVEFTAVCAHTDGRVYIAGSLDNFLLIDRSYWIPTNTHFLYTISADAELASNGIYWSCIGADELPQLLMPSYEEDPTKILDRWERQECGFTVWPYDGKIRTILSLGEGLMVYGDTGIAYLQPSTSPITVGLIKLSNNGIPRFSYACGNNFLHYFVDNNDELWKVEPGPKLQKLGFNTHISTLGSVNLVLHPTEDKLYINGNDSCYMLSDGVLVECPEMVYSVASVYNKYTGSTITGITKPLTSEFEVETGVYDFGSRDLKTVSRLDCLGFASSSGFHGKVFYRMTTASCWADTGWITLPLDRRITAREFKFAAKANSLSSAFLTYLEVELDTEPSRYSFGEQI